MNRVPDSPAPIRASRSHSGHFLLAEKSYAPLRAQYSIVKPLPLVPGAGIEPAPPEEEGGLSLDAPV